MDAMERAQQMLLVPMNQLPELAIGYAKRLCSQVGGCIEVLLTAYAVYAQIVEKLPCDDVYYQPIPDAIEWFTEHGHQYQQAVTINSKGSE